MVNNQPDPREPEFYRCPENRRRLVFDALLVAALVATVMLAGLWVANLLGV